MKRLFYRVCSLFISLTFLFTQFPALAHGTNDEVLSKLIKKIQYVNYDCREDGNISIVKEGDTPKVWYFYDEKNQLIREDNKILDKTITYSYDSRGNIKNKKFYTFVNGNFKNQVSENTVAYEYANLDRMISYNGQKITYDEVGNPIQYCNGWLFEWTKNRQLSKSSKCDNNIEYIYNDKGVRTQKIVNGVTTEFTTKDTGITELLTQKSGENVIKWYPSNSNECVSFEYNGTKYIYTYNFQGDVTGIVDVKGNTIANYTYDSWGKLISITDENGKDITNDTSHIGYINPLRYRGYYYDSETKLYYLNSRYYDPEVGRFLNEDDREFLKTIDDIDISTYNLYAYCLNNPVNLVDYDGRVAIVLAGIAFTTPELIAIAATLVYSVNYIANPNFKSAVEQAVGWAIRTSTESAAAIQSAFKAVGAWAAGQIAKLVTAYKLHMIENIISSRIKTPDGRVDVSKFTNPNGPLMPKGGRGILGPLAYYIVKDIDQHKGGVWKLFKAGIRIATLAADGKILGK